MDTLDTSSDEYALGRPLGRFTQHRRMDRLRELLTRHP